MVKQIPYEILEISGKMEIRRYPEIILAKVKGRTGNGAFGILFDYIQGNNRSRRSISMTAPVISSESISMTSPVISDEISFSFVMPPEMKMDEVPLPLNDEIEIEKVPERTLVVIRFSGRTTDSRLAKFSAQLLDHIQANDIKVRGEPILMRYDPPIVLGPFRRNELALEVIES
jgi:hypothetical protein